ncbi:tautomerase family protein [Phycicoccus flavus]|uniref:tautomerase family protein n=1 Tax=Phycicoccus flavus TaxID=2502783 RepID=UPI000FEBF763|nr:tautomerase family protein [Phycicoccus flavus]NHA68618.1 tautomerase family protein [Phycicoccus flavus]NHA68683.1 tautomerase family protein [Phycicoccus flavus]
MPLVRIDINEGRSADELRRLADTVQDCVVDAFEVPADDRYQIVTQHALGQMIILDTGLGFERTERAVVVHIFTSPRTPDMKKRLYSLLAERLQDRTGLDPQDLFVSIMTNGTDDWSFGNGEAQYLVGRL